MASPLLRTDWDTLKGWLRTQTAAKVVVMIGFLITVLAVMAGIYTLGFSYYRMLLSYEVFGEVIITYTLNASIIILLVLGIFSSMAAVYRTFFATRQLSHWLTLPIPQKTIVRTIEMKSLLASAWPFIVLLLPFLAAWTGQQPSAGRIASSLVVIASLTVLTQGIGTILVIWLTRNRGPMSRIFWWGLGVIMVLSLISVTKLLFPPALFKLNESPTQASFIQNIQELPLNSAYLPSYWLTSTVTQGFSWMTILAVTLAWLIFKAAERLLDRNHLKIWYAINDQPLLSGKHTGITAHHHFPYFRHETMRLLTNDWWWLMRSAGEVSYLLFVLGLGLIYTLIIKLIPQHGQMEAGWLPLLYLAAMGGLSYLVLVMSARFVYPLMAKDTKALWFIFSAPIARWRLFDAKLVLTLTALIPWCLLAVVITSSLPLAGQLAESFWLLLISAAAGVGLIHLCLGIIAPNFAEAEQAEASSTSVSGLLALILSMAWIAGVMAVWQDLFTGSRAAITVLGITAIGGGILMISLVYRQINRYEKI